MTDSKAIDARPPVKLQEAQLGEFVATGAVTRIEAVGKADGFELHVDIGAASGVLGNARGVVRTFSSLNTMAGLLRRLGADRFSVEIGDFQSSEPTPPEPATADKARAAKPNPSPSKPSSVAKPKTTTKKKIKGSL